VSLNGGIGVTKALVPAAASTVDVSGLALFVGAPDAMMVIDAQWEICSINAEFERMFGYRQEELLGRRYDVLLPVRFRNRDQTTSFGAGPVRLGSAGEFFVLRKDGSEIPVEVKASRLEDNRVVVSVRDSSDRYQNVADLRDAVSLLNATLESTGDGVLVVNQNGQIVRINKQFLTMWGIPEHVLEARSDDELLSFVMNQLVDPEGFVDRVRALYGNPDAQSNDFLEFHDGRIFERRSGPQRVDDVVVGRVWNFRDDTARFRAEGQAREQAEQLKVLALRDPLTGLANRLLLNARLEGALVEPGSVGVLILDLDDFKEVNDILGHQVGDEVLIEVGKRLRMCVRSVDTVARLGGDEFAVLLKDVTSPEGVARKIVAALRVPIDIAGKELHLGVSMGICSTADTSMRASEMMRQCDIAMHAAKVAGKNRYLRFRPDMMAALLARIDIEEGLRHAVERDEIIVHFQPILAADSLMTQVEALARWQRPTGLVPPLDFIPVAESSRLINGIGQAVLALAFRQLRPWLDESELNSVAVNVSSVQLLEEDFARRVLETVAQSGVRPQQVELEVTESVFLHPGRMATDQLTLLRDRGIKVAIDDFGTGYSSLGRLHDLPLDVLKIDKGFVDLIQTGTENLSIIRSMIDLAHNLELHVTAEGVETDVQATTLLRLGCDALQGYLLSRPRAIEDLPEALERSRQTMQGLFPARD